MKRSRSQSLPSLEMEREDVERCGGPVAGVDEAGRGPLAGPVVAAAVAFTETDVRARGGPALNGLNDSKALTEAAREVLFDEITEAFEVGVAVGDVARIDRCNILNATLWAMRSAVEQLSTTPAAVLVDGNRDPGFACPSRAIVKGDSRCLSIAAASVVAKVTRDRMMLELAAVHPEYGFERHKGYGTREHLAAIAVHGVTEHHRRSFRPVRVALGLDEAAG